MIDERDAGAQLNQSIRDNQEGLSFISKLGKSDFTPLDVLKIANAVGMAMEDAEYNKELTSFVIGVQGMLFDGDWNKPKAKMSNYEHQIDAFTSQVWRRIGSVSVNEQNAEQEFSLIDLTALYVIFYQLTNFSIKPDTRKNIITKLKKFKKDKFTRGVMQILQD